MYVDKIISSDIYSKFENYNYLVVFAVGKNFLNFEKQFEDTLITTKKLFIIDNAKSKVGTEILLWNKKYIIHDSEELKSILLQKNESVAIIITCNAYKEIASQLENDEALRNVDAYFFKDINPVALYLPATRKYKLLNKWLCLKNVGGSICDAESIKDINKIAFYGLEDIGKRFVEDLNSRDKKISFCVVPKKLTYFTNFDLYTIDEELPACDLFVITDIEKYSSLRKALRLPSETKIYAIDSLLEEIWARHWNLI